MNTVLPSAINAEMELLAAILVDNRYIAKCVEYLNIQDFYLEKHKMIFSAMCSLFSEGDGIEIVTLIEVIGKENLAKVGGITYLAELTNSGLSLDVDAYIKIIKDKSARREGIKNLQLAAKNLYDESKKTNEILGELQGKLVERAGSKKTIISDEELFDRVLNGIEERIENGGGIPGMITGFNDFDRATNGLKRGELFIIGGRPSMGKTLIALNTADGLAKNGYKVGIIELEMTEEELGNRRLAYNANVEANKIQTGRLDDREVEKVVATVNALSKRNNIYTDCSDYQSILTIKAKAKAMKQSKGLDILMIDHLGLMDIQEKENRTLAIGEVTRQLKLLAKELEINVILLCQLSRAVEQRADKRPMLSDLRESGNIEQDADLVLFAYRDEYYNHDSEEKNIMEWILAKQRNGKTGTIKVAYIDKLQKITNLDWNN